MSFKMGLGVVFGFIGFMGITLFLYNSSDHAKQVGENRRMLPGLVQRCNQKAAGQDGILSFKEGVSLARELGWKDPIYDGEKINLYFDHGWATSFLLVGYNPTPGLLEDVARVGMVVSSETLQNYLDSK